MYGLKNKFSEKLSGLFGEANNSSTSSSEARRYSKENKSLSSYFSNIVPSASFERFRSDKHHYDHKPTTSLPSKYRHGKNDSFDRYEGYNMLCTPKNGLSEDLEDEDQASGRSSGSSEVFEEALEQCSLHDPLSNLSDESSYISPDLYEFLEACLPNIVKGCKWVLLYSTLKHGISLRTLIRNSAELTGPCLLIVGDKQGAVFGGLLESPLKPTPKRKYQGSNQTFVFTTLYGPPRLFRPTGANRYYFMCLSDLLALGGGGSFALCLDGDLLNGSSGPCDTFGNLCLAHSPEFELKNVELWGFAHASRYRAG